MGISALVNDRVAVAAHLPHYGPWAAAIGLGILALIVIVAAISAARSNRRRR
ncbi:MAG: hypothetical protein ACJ72W_20845 [Actinoallomurus sp.]